MEEKSSYQGKAKLIIRTLGVTTEEEVSIDANNVLEILRKSHEIQILSVGPNKFVKCVDGICAKGGYWWQFSINGRLVLESIDNYYPKDGDILMLEYGEEE